jgi:probable rRNA maturation factor
MPGTFSQVSIQAACRSCEHETVVDRASRLYLPPLRIDVTVRAGVPRLVPLARLGRAIRAAALASGAPTPASVGLVLTDDAELAGLNREHMGKRGPTDVLSFPLLPLEAFARGGPDGRGGSRLRDHRQSITSMTAAGSPGGSPPSVAAFVLPPHVRTALGDIAVSIERAIAQAREGRGGQDNQTAWDAQDELLLLVTHGTLHLCGWDHAEPDEDWAMRALEGRLLTGP